MKTPPHAPSVTQDLHKLLKRRKTLAVATAMGVAGCTMLAPNKTVTQVPDSQGKRVADTMVESYTRDIELALDHVDRKRLDAARQAGSGKAEPSKPEVLKEISAAPAKNGSTAASTDHATEPVAHAAPAPKSAAPAPVPAHTEPAPTAAAHGPAAVAVPAVKPAPSADQGAAPAVPPLLARPAPPAPAAPTPAAAPAAPAVASHADSHAEPAPRTIVTASPMTGVVVASSESVPAAIVNPHLPAATPVAAMGAMSAIISAGPASPAAAAMVEHANTNQDPSLDEALSVVRKSIATHPTLHTALALALLDGKNPDSDLAKMLSEADQRVLGDLVAALDTMKATPASGSLGTAERAAPLVDAAKKWQQDSELTLPCLALANRVDSYGVFTLVSPTFEQGRRHTIIIYCEVANFGSRKGEDGWFTTRLTQQESLITEDKLLVWRPNAEEVEDRSMNQRHDFYLVKKLTIPETLAAGKYTLRMDVTDANSGKRAVQSMEIRVVSK